jgi:hypothetical protein
MIAAGAIILVLVVPAIIALVGLALAAATIAAMAEESLVADSPAD